MRTDSTIKLTLALMCGLVVFSLRSGAAAITIGPATVVPIPDSPVYYFVNDSAFPYLPNSNGTANITFWVNGANFRSEGPSLDSMKPINPTTSVLSGTPGTFDRNGIWLLSAVRRNGKLYGFYGAVHIHAAQTVLPLSGAMRCKNKEIAPSFKLK